MNESLHEKVQAEMGETHRLVLRQMPTQISTCIDACSHSGKEGMKMLLLSLVSDVSS